MSNSQIPAYLLKCPSCSENIGNDFQKRPCPWYSLKARILVCGKCSALIKPTKWTMAYFWGLMAIGIAALALDVDALLYAFVVGLFGLFVLSALGMSHSPVAVDTSSNRSGGVGS